MTKQTYYNILLIVFAISIVISNVVGSRVITTGIKIGGIELATSGGAITYAFTFLCTDIIGELWGKNKAVEVVKYGLIGQLFALFMIVITGWFPAMDKGIDEAYKTLLGTNWCFVLGSLCAYYASQLWDVWVFHKLRELYIKHKNIDKNAYQGQGRWIWNNISTGTSQIIDTAIYTSISFGIGMGWFFQQNMFGTLLGIVIGQYLIKLAIAIFDTPFFYLLTGRKFRCLR